MAKRCLILLMLCFAVVGAHARGVYQAPEEFLREVFAGQAPEPRLLWLTRDLRPDVRKIMGHDLDIQRVRYWEQNGRTSWVLEEIGKEEPITVGIVVNRGKIELVRILAFRESRGDEVRYPFFTNQFRGAGMREDERLDREIDGISGATLSVRAVTRLARLALYLDGKTRAPQ